MAFEFYSHLKPGTNEACEATVVEQDVTAEGLWFTACEICGYREEYPTEDELMDKDSEPKKKRKPRKN